MYKQIFRLLDEHRERAVHAAKEIKHDIRVCCGAGCIANGSRDIYDEFARQFKKRGVGVSLWYEQCLEKKSDILTTITGCQGFCEAGPLVSIEPLGLCFYGVKQKDVEKIILHLLDNEKLPDKLLHQREGSLYTCTEDVPFYKHQKKIVLDGCGKINPKSFLSYLKNGGFLGFQRALEMKPEEILDEIKKAGLRGRGGAGFLTYKKWSSSIEAARESKSDIYLICNGDEGDPGAFMDCALMEGDPYKIIEGMLIAARATGSKTGYIYVRREYPRAVKRLKSAVLSLMEMSLLGKAIGSSDMDFNIKIITGGGAFVCGESSALMKSIEGHVGEPRSKYVRSSYKGLFEKPTILNNVETFACVTSILKEGHKIFSNIGTAKSFGTKAFCLTGKVKNTGLIEIPMGVSLRHVIFEIGGGLHPNRKFKAVQTGGPSGGCLSEKFLDTPIGFDELEEVGSMMGSGGMIVLDDHSCVVDVTRYYTNFLKFESCGKCVPCREGLSHLYRIMSSICQGSGEIKDIQTIEKICFSMQKSALCGLGKSAVNPVLSLLKNFKNELEEHIEKKYCSSGVCNELFSFYISKNCTGCMKCLSNCPTSAITGKKWEVHIIDDDKCTRCGACRTVCKYEAVQVRQVKK